MLFFQSKGWHKCKKGVEHIKTSFKEV